MSITQRHLLANASLGLRILVDPEGSEQTSTLDSPIEWVHSSDLVDPTPFLTPETVLLTTGAQFSTQSSTQFGGESGGEHRDEYRAYVHRLVTLGISGLGFGSDVSREGTPASLIEACEDLGLPLFEVPYKTPFIAIVRLAADLISDEKHTRDSWSLSAQRAIAVAALRPDGLAASLRELSRQLGSWVALYDTAGNASQVFPESALTSALADDVTGEVHKLLAAGTRSSMSSTHQAQRVALQTLGATGHLRGVLAIGGDGPPDSAGLAVVTSVVALASLALEQSHALSQATRHLRTGTLQSLIDGNIDAAKNTSDLLWGGLPTDPVTVIACDLPAGRDTAVVENLELLTSHAAGTMFYADLDDNLIVLCDEAGLTTAAEYFLGASVGIGSSNAGTLDDLGTLISQARQSLTHALDGAETLHVKFEELADQGMWSLIQRAPARLVADALLAPLRDNDRNTGGHLEHTAQRWLLHNGQWAPAAADLGIHRHTLRHRVELIEHLLSRDLSSFNARAELWAALQYASQPTDPPHEL